MYATCLHCREPLGRNESIEALPIGRRVAVDAKLGRLWVVCRSCERWNLTPFEERWEAIEQAERAFRDTRVRVSTENIGLARLREGTEIVRIGKPLRPEFAAWRYGDQFGRRRRRYTAMAVAATAGAGALVAGAVSLGIGLAAAAPLIHVVNMTMLLAAMGRKGRRMALPDGGFFEPIGMPRLIAAPTQAGWGVDIGYTRKRDAQDTRPSHLFWGDKGFDSNEGKNEMGRVQLFGNDAVPLLREFLPVINRSGAVGTLIRDSVSLIDDAGGPEHFARWAAAKRGEWAAKQTFGDTGDFNYIPAAARLAFEMAVFEDAERQAMDGELATLERAWADAEGVARIADSLLVPPDVQHKLDDLRAHKPSE
ncbi:hypothetical protein [Gemmatimonas sp.]|uniref:hypothetical protein n=1 Tax=Gemmatimonas sp. TaxID=1962908 RepID=UPI00333E37A7